MRKACGLYSPGSHVTLGVARSAVQLASCACRCSMSASHEPSGRSDGHAQAVQLAGTASAYSAPIRRSMASETERSPLSPLSSSSSERRISKSSRLVRSHSCRKTDVYGVRSSAPTRPSRSPSAKSSGSLSRMSSRRRFTCNGNVTVNVTAM